MSAKSDPKKESIPKKPSKERRPKSRKASLTSSSLMEAQRIYQDDQNRFRAPVLATPPTSAGSAGKHLYTYKGKPAEVYATVLMPSGGYKYTYTGSVETTKEEQKKRVSRLSAYDPERVPDSRRVMSSEHRDKGGNALSYQWTAGGQTCHGFIW